MKILSSINRKVKKIAGNAGYNFSITKIPHYPKGHELIVSSTTYAPWLSDNDFNNIYGLIRPYTLVDKYRCYTLWQLLEETKNLPGAVIEVGVWKGGTTVLLAKKMKLLGIQEKIYACDTFTGVVKASEKDSRYKGGEHADTSEEIVKEIVSAANLDNVKILKGIFPEETSKHIKEKQFRFCHLDVDVYQSTKDIFNLVWPRMAPGGVVVFDDYGFKTTNGITQFVNEQKMRKDAVVIYNFTGQAHMIKR